jgi:hypothetical protein
LPVGSIGNLLIDADIPKKIRSLDAGPLEDRLLDDGRPQFRRNKDYFEGKIGQISLDILSKCPLKLYLSPFGIVLRVSDLDFIDKDLGFLFGSFIEFTIFLECMQVKVDDNFLRMMRAYQRLQAHESITHVLELRLE